MLNWVGSRSDPFGFFDWVGGWDNFFVMRNGVWFRGDVFDVFDLVRRRSDSLINFIRDQIWNNNFDVGNGNWFWLDPFNVLNWNVFDGGD